MYDSYRRNSWVTVNMERKTKRDGYRFEELTCSQKKGTSTSKGLLCHPQTNLTYIRTEYIKNAFFIVLLKETHNSNLDDFYF